MFSLHLCLDEPDDEQRNAIIAENISNSLPAGIAMSYFCRRFENCEHGNCARIDLESEDSSIPPSAICFELETVVTGVYSAQPHGATCNEAEIFAALRNYADTLAPQNCSAEEAASLAEIFDKEGCEDLEEYGDLHSNAVSMLIHTLAATRAVTARENGSRPRTLSGKFRNFRIPEAEEFTAETELEFECYSDAFDYETRPTVVLRAGTRVKVLMRGNAHVTTQIKVY